jgi:hypothetical protein
MRVGERVAQQCLHRQARQREQRPDARRGKHARRAQRDDQHGVKPAAADQQCGSMCSA